MLRLKSSVCLALALLPAAWGQGSDNRPPLIVINGDVGRLLAGNSQSTLSVVVTDRSGAPLANQPVLFVAPATGATGSFLNSPSADGSFFRVMTDGAGAATATFVTNATPGVYLVEAMVEGTAASVTFAITNVAGDATPPPLAAADVRAAVEQKLLFGTQLDETLSVHGPVLTPAGGTVTAAFPPSASIAAQPYTTDRQSWVLWIDEQPGFRFGHRVRFVIVNAADTTADLSKARITREQSWPVVRLSADGAPNPLLPPSGLNDRPFLKASNQTSQLQSINPGSIHPTGILAFTPGACAILVHGVVKGGASDVVNMQNFLVGSGRVSGGNAFTQASPNGRNAPATRKELAALIQLAADFGCPKVYLYISAHGTASGSVELVNGDTGEADPVYSDELQKMLAPLKGVEICPIIDTCYSGALASAFQGIGSTGTFVGASDATHTAMGNVNGGLFTNALIKCWMDPKASSTGDGMVTLADAEKWVEKNAGQDVTGAKPLSAPINPKNIVLSIPAVSGKAGEQGKVVITRPSNYPLNMRIAAILMLPDTRTATLGRFGERTIEATFGPGDQTVTIQVNFKSDGEVNAFFDGTDPSNLVKVTGSVHIAVGGPFFLVNPPMALTPKSTTPLTIGRFEGQEQTLRQAILQVNSQDPVIAVPDPDILMFDPYQVYADLRVRAMAPGQTSFSLLDSFFAYQDNFTFNVAFMPVINSITPPPTISDSPVTYTVNGMNLQNVVAVFIKSDTATTQVPAQNVTPNYFQFLYRYISQDNIYKISAVDGLGQTSNELKGNVQRPPPVIIRADPSNFPASSLTRNITLNGTGFDPNMKISCTGPDGVTLAPQAQEVTPPRCLMALLAARRGDYTCRATNPDGQTSNPISVTATDPVPNITSIDPPSPGVGSQVVTVFGLDFPNVFTLGLGFEDGSGMGISGLPIQHVSPTRFDVSLQFNKAGQYQMQVVPDKGPPGNIFTFTVLGSSPGPLINRTDPATFTASTSSVLITIIGSNIVNGASVVVTPPGGAPMTFSGSQVQFLGPNAVQIQVVLNMPGNGSITITNPNGASTSPFAFFVAAPGPTSPLTGGCPAKSARVNVFYSSPITASGGMPSYIFSIVAGSLPQGLMLDSWTGIVSGTPGSVGTSTFDAQVGDSKGTKVGFTCSITDLAPLLTCNCPADFGKSGEPYNSAVTSTGGTSPKTFSITSGSLPGGLTLTPSSGAISGTPNATGTANFTAKAMDSTGMATANCSIAITGCTKGSDCGSGVCTSGVCQVPTCSDGVKNGMETDVDCGGPTCGKCGNSRMCTGNSDCQSNFCNGGVCQPLPAPTCTDGVKNGMETDVDCGGGVCPACPSGRMCSIGSDCQSKVCTGGRCQAPSCSDGVKNGMETDVDCGGGTCSACPSGRMCSIGSDCQSKVCTGGMCQAPTCSDGVKNGQETDVDCGGPTCGKCGTGKMCTVNGDCSSGLCGGGVCQAGQPTPMINLVGPLNLMASPSPQPVFVSGNNFQPGPGFTVLVGFPGGGGITLTGAQIQNATPNGFQFFVVLSAPGSYSITVHNQGGPNSNTVVFMVK